MNKHFCIEAVPWHCVNNKDETTVYFGMRLFLSALFAIEIDGKLQNIDKCWDFVRLWLSCNFFASLTPWRRSTELQAYFVNFVPMPIQFGDYLTSCLIIFSQIPHTHAHCILHSIRNGEKSDINSSSMPEDPKI